MTVVELDLSEHPAKWWDHLLMFAPEEWELAEAMSAPLDSCGPRCDAMCFCDEEE